MKLLCKVMQLNRSGYYRYIQRVEAHSGSVSDARMEVAVKALHEQSQGSYGSRRMAKALQAQGYAVGRYKARRLMREAGVTCRQRRRYRVTTRADASLPVADNTLNRQFQVATPNQAWVADITFLWTVEGWLYLAAVLDLYSRKVVGWSMAAHMCTVLVSNALCMALGRRQPERGLLHHSDRGCQYASLNYREQLHQQGIVMSMSRQGNCWDNAVMERFFGSLKSERTEGKIYLTREQAKADVVDYIEMFYNSQRLHSTLGYVSPVQFEKQNRSPLTNVSTLA